MAYKWNDKGLIVADGLPDGLTVDVNQYQSALKQLEKSKNVGFNALYPSVNTTQLSDSITKFVYNNGKVQGFVPEVTPTNNNNFMGLNDNNILSRQGNSPFSFDTTPKGYLVDVGGIVFDPASKSGNIPNGAEVTFSNDQGSTLATFKQGSTISGYMRLATQQAKAADSLRLGNQSGTLSGSVRQNAQRRTIL